ncbi:hypothetical protein P170DRAFT_423105 [Aspergillus steynii IBT 23096]|uniref:Uncharacterized protein n=1 Tax=Aspergillus steynii IBT 23096 TaxID=1392250 RepID=A0A2I2GH54_9EURO|nr:uncharacterized protein P170DRAFT_423105 [Aspergillus steynii IBT 23096]PLB52209.1 hypothetical protein P170DRAFT_423105 [Aspergillus steynii IBT 23096]
MRPLGTDEENEGLVFVHISRPDDLKARGTRRTIRQKAMREIGKSRRSRKRPQTWELSLKEQPPEDDGLSTTSSQSTLTPCSPRKPIAFDPHNASYYPIQLDDRIMQLIHFMSADSDYVFRPFRAIWFSMAMTDASAFLVSLANAAMFLDQIYQRKAYQYEKSVECLTYYGKCVKEVTRRLENSKDRLSAGLITTILGFMSGLWLAHGLIWRESSGSSRCEEDTTGFTRLPRFSFLGSSSDLEKLADANTLRFDVIISVVEDLSPRSAGFDPSVSKLSDNIEIHTPPFLRYLVSDIALHHPEFDHVDTAFEKLAVTVKHLNDNAHQPPGYWKNEENTISIKLFGPVTHYLLSMDRPVYPPKTQPSIKDEPSSDDDKGVNAAKSAEFTREMIRLSILIMLATIKNNMFQLAAREAMFLREKLSKVIDYLRGIRSASTSLWKVQLWSLVIVSLVEMSDPISVPGEAGYVDDICRLMELLCIMTGCEAVGLVKDMLWVESIWDAVTVDDLVSQIDSHLYS